MNTRRQLIQMITALPVLAGASRVFPQARKKPVLIGWLHSASRKTGGKFLNNFKEAFASLGWEEKSDYVLDERWAEGDAGKLQGYAEALAARKPAVIVAAPSTATRFVLQAAPNVPIVQASGSSPVARGRAASLSHPGGMLTGITSIADETSEKVVELLVETIPKVRHIGFLVDGFAPSIARTQRIESATRWAARLNVKAYFAEAARLIEVVSAFDQLRKNGAEAVVILPSGWFEGQREHIVKFALANRWSVAAGAEEWAESGALLGYGADRSALYRRAAWYTDRIIKGAKPADLPIEQPTRFELVINKRTAAVLGITIPQTILIRADRVIE